MKKVVLICGLIALIVGCLCWFYQNQEEKFVNPLFYETMTSVEYPEFEAQITPTHIHIKENELISRDYNCQLDINQKDKIVLECPIYYEAYDKNIITTFTYTIKPGTEKDEWLITQNMEPHDDYYEDVIYKISSGKADKTTAEKFVNPLFYKTLLPLSKIAWQTELTPSLQVISNDGKTDISTCKMLQNNMDYVILQCTYFNILQKSYVTDCYKYKIWQCNPRKEYCYGLTWKVKQTQLDCKTLSKEGSFFYFMVDEEE